MDLTLRTFTEDGVTPLNSDYTVNYYASGVLTEVTGSGVPSLNIPDVDDGTEVRIDIESSGRHSYSTNIKVHFLDVDVSIKMVSVITNILDPNYLNPYPFFFSILDPCTYGVDVYNASSAPFGAASWYLNNELIDGVGGNIHIPFPGAGNYQVKRRVAVTDPAVPGSLLWDRYYMTGGTAVGSTGNSVEDNLALELDTNTLIEEIVPELKIEINAPSDILNGVTYYNRLEVIEVETFFTNISPHVDPNNLVLEYEIIDPEGVRVTGSNDVVNLAVAVPDTTNQFTLSKRGDYKVIANVTDDCTTHSVEIIIPAYNFIQFIPDEEYQYTIFNQSNTIPISYMVEYLTANGFVSYVDSTDINTKESDELILSNQGVYKVTSTFTDLEDNERTEITILHYYGELKDCLTNLTMNVLCEPEGGCGCDSVESTGLLLEMYTLSQTYFMYLQEEYGFNNIYTALDDSKLVDLADIDVFLKKLERYCKAYSCFDNKPCSCGTCASCLNQSATTLQIISGRTSATSTATDCGCTSGCSSCS